MFDDLLRMAFKELCFLHISYSPFFCFVFLFDDLLHMAYKEVCFLPISYCTSFCSLCNKDFRVNLLSYTPLQC